MSEAPAEFDQYANQYSTLHENNIAISGFKPSYFDEMKISLIEKKLQNSPLNTQSELRILNFGCGIGRSDALFLQYFPHAELIGADPSEASIQKAKETSPSQSQCSYHVIPENNHLPDFEPVDMIVASNVFHHIPHNEHPTVMEQLYRRLKTGGKLFLIEHNPLNPLTRHAVNTCEFDEHAVLLWPSYAKKLFKNAGLVNINKSYIVFFPAALKALLKYEKHLEWCPAGAQYMMMGDKT